MRLTTAKTLAPRWRLGLVTRTASIFTVSGDAALCLRDTGSTDVNIYLGETLAAPSRSPRQLL